MKRYLILTFLASIALTMTLVQWVFAEVPVEEASVSITTPTEETNPANESGNSAGTPMQCCCLA